jgi:hypothetical protein
MTTPAMTVIMTVRMTAQATTATTAPTTKLRAVSQDRQNHTDMGR